jgi:glutathione S-transferase
MKLYQSIGPNPQVVKMFIAEKGIDVPREEVDIRAGVNRQTDFLKINPRGQSPALITDSGQLISEVTAICEYLEEAYPTPALIGTTADERGETRMWTRRIDLGICEPMANGFRYGEGIKMFEPRMRVIPHASDDLKACAQDIIGWLDKEMEGKTWVCGNRFTLADMMLFVWLDFFAGVGQPINPEFKNIVAHHARTKARPTSSAT